MPHIRSDPKLAEEGKLKVEWAFEAMPVLKLIMQRFEREKPLSGVRVGACLHVTTETANLMRVLKAGGADLRLCASNPLSTNDAVASALVNEYGVDTYAIRGEDRETYYHHIMEVLGFKPQVTMDDGADLAFSLHSEKEELLKEVVGGTEETTTGVIRLKAMAGEGMLRYPIIAVNDAQTKQMFDNRYGTGQSTIDGILRATNRLLAGSRFVVCGYGWCGRGVAMRARGAGALVIVTEVDPLKALEAHMDGYEVMSMAQAAKVGDIFCTVTGDIHIIRAEHFQAMKDGAVVCNAGHFNVEIDLETLERLAVKVRPIRDEVTEYTLDAGRRVNVLSEGRLVNLAAAEGHPSSVMDMSFANQALSAEYLVKHKDGLEKAVHPVPLDIDRNIAALKLESKNIAIDTLTEEQVKYLASWDMGT